MEGGSDLGTGLLNGPTGPKRRTVPQNDDDDEEMQTKGDGNYQDLKEDNEDSESLTDGSTEELNSKCRKVRNTFINKNV